MATEHVPDGAEQVLSGAVMLAKQVNATSLSMLYLTSELEGSLGICRVVKCPLGVGNT